MHRLNMLDVLGSWFRDTSGVCLQPPIWYGPLLLFAQILFAVSRDLNVTMIPRQQCCQSGAPPVDVLVLFTEVKLVQGTMCVFSVFPGIPT